MQFQSVVAVYSIKSAQVTIIVCVLYALPLMGLIWV